MDMSLHLEGEYTSETTHRRTQRKSGYNKYKDIVGEKGVTGAMAVAECAKRPDYYLSEERKEIIRKVVEIQSTVPFISAYALARAVGISWTSLYVYKVTCYYKQLMQERADKLIEKCKVDLRVHAKDAIKEVDVYALRGLSKRGDASRQDTGVLSTAE
jgi:hypothetical protein